MVMQQLGLSATQRQFRGLGFRANLGAFVFEVLGLRAQGFWSVGLTVKGLEFMQGFRVPG